LLPSFCVEVPAGCAKFFAAASITNSLEHEPSVPSFVLFAFTHQHQVNSVQACVRAITKGNTTSPTVLAPLAPLVENWKNDAAVLDLVLLRLHGRPSI
jgi:urease accessory protein UreF